MSSQPPYSLTSSPAPHGGDMDPNEIRLRQARAQAASSSYVQSLNSPSAIAMANAPHGGDMDPNEVRLRLARGQQVSGLPPPVVSNTGTSNSVASQGGSRVQQPYGQPAQYGSGSHLISPSATPYQTTQSPSAPSGPSTPAQYGPQSSYFVQTQQSPQPNQPGSSIPVL